MKLNTKQLQETYSIKASTLRSKADKLEYLAELGVEATFEKQGRNIIYTIINDELYNELRTIKETTGVNLRAEELEDFKCCIEAWLSPNVPSIRELTNKLGHSNDNRVRYWRRQVFENGLVPCYAPAPRKQEVKYDPIYDTDLHKLYFIIENSNNAVIYIGITNDLNRRYLDHFVRQTEPNKPLYDYVNKMGLENFTMEVRACHEDREFIVEMEKQLIRHTPGLLNVIHNTQEEEEIELASRAPTFYLRPLYFPLLLELT